MTHPRPNASLAGRILAFLKAIPLKLMICLVVAAAAIGEQFPFSPFPMFSTWSEESYLVYFQDKNGDPIPIQTLTYLSAGRYRGMFEAELKVIKSENRKAERKPDVIADFGADEYRRAGTRILDWIDENVHPDLVAQLEPLRPLNVVRRVIKLSDGELSHVDTVVATDSDRATESR